MVRFCKTHNCWILYDESTGIAIRKAFKHEIPKEIVDNIRKKYKRTLEESYRYQVILNELEEISPKQAWKEILFNLKDIFKLTKALLRGIFKHAVSPSIKSSAD